MICQHQSTKIWEPHLAGARKCIDCGMVFNPNMNPQWYVEPPPIEERLESALAAIAHLRQALKNCHRFGKELCEDIRVSVHQYSLERAEHALAATSGYEKE